MRGTVPAGQPIAERAVAVTEAALGPDHPDVAIWRNNLGGVLRAPGDLAAPGSSRAVPEIGEAALGPDHPDVAIWRSNLGRVPRISGPDPAYRTPSRKTIKSAARCRRWPRRRASTCVTASLSMWI